jgi:hypothetical protein
VDNTSAANDWLLASEPWEARLSPAQLLQSSYEEAAARSRARCEALRSWPLPFSQAGFAWVTPPVLNRMTRIAVEMCAATGTLRAAGYELDHTGELPRPVTRIREISSAVPNRAETATAQL